MHQNPNQLNLLLIQHKAQLELQVHKESYTLQMGHVGALFLTWPIQQRLVYIFHNNIVGGEAFSFCSTFLGFEKGRFMKEASVARTGKPLPEKVNIKMVIDKVNLDRIMN